MTTVSTLQSSEEHMGGQRMSGVSSSLPLLFCEAQPYRLQACTLTLSPVRVVGLLGPADTNDDFFF